MPQINGTNGTWTYSVTSADPDEVKIEFKPKAGTCKDIRLAQIAKKVGHAEDGTEVDGPPELWINPFGGEHTKKDRVKDDSGHVAWIDHLACEGDPFMNGDDIPHERASRGDATAKPPTSTEFTDGPSLPADSMAKSVVKVVTDFETCAICAESGEILGCITWSSTATKKPAKKGTITVNPANAETPCSRTFRGALRTFVANHLKKDSDDKLHWWCPEADDKVKGPTGETGKPFGKEPPQGFVKKWFSIAPWPLSVSDVSSIGRAREIQSANEAIARARLNLAECCVKFTWAGPQDKVVSSLLFTDADDLDATELGPYLHQGSPFQNDLISLFVFTVTTEFLDVLVAELESLRGDLGGWTLVSLLTGLHSEERAFFTWTLNGETVRRIIANLSELPRLGPMEQSGLSFIKLNMAHV